MRINYKIIFPFRRRYTIFLLLFLSLTVVSESSSQNLTEYKIDKIDIEGNKNFSDKKILSLMRTKETSILRSSIFSKHVLENDLKRIVIFYQNEGYLQASIVNYSIESDTTEKKINIDIKIKENTIYNIKKISFKGNKQIGDDYFLKKIDISCGEAFKVLSVERAKIEITTLYNEKGFLDAHVQFEFDSLQHTENIGIDFIITEGTRYKIGNIHIKGLEKTKENIVTREFRFKKDEYYSPDKIVETQKYLYRTGLFYSVNIKDQTSSEDSTKKDITFIVKESEAGEFDIGIGYGSIEKIRVTTSLSYVNFFGKSYRGKILGRISSIERRLETTITDPWIFGIPIEGALGFELAKDKQPSYDLFYYNIKLNLLKEFNFKSKSTLLFEYGTGKYTDIKSSYYDEFNTNYGIDKDTILVFLNNLNYNIDRSGVKWSIYRDYRDNIFNPQKGNYIDAAVQYIYGQANLIFFEKYKKQLFNNVLKFTGNYRYYLKISESALLASSFDFGIMDFFNSSDLKFLLSDLFYAGGPNSLRGFGYREVGPKDKNGIALGGKLKTVWNAIEYRQKFISFLEGAFFIDAGNVWNSYKDFSFSDIRIDYGLGLRISSPVGIIRFDLAFNPFPQEKETKYQFWFGIGQAF